MDWQVYLGLGALALALSASITPIVIHICRRTKTLDKPDKRKIHKTGMPRLGGAAIFVSISLCLVLAVLAIIAGWLEMDLEQARLIPALYLGFCGFFFIGFIDDLKSLPMLPRLVAQAVFAAAVIWLSGGTVTIGTLLGHYILPEWLAYLLTVLWIVGVVNTFNWIDGLDGLAAGVATISAGAFLLLAILETGLPNATLTITFCILLIGATLGFLPYNFHPAKIFIGDGGAYALGYLLAVVSIIGLFKQAALISFFAPVFILALPLTDTAFAIVRRLWRGMPVTQPDNRHIHHRMLATLSRTYRSKLPEEELGYLEEQLVKHKAHRNTVLSLYAFAALFAAIAVWAGLNS